MPACVPLPLMTIENSLLDAMMGPGVRPNLPGGMPGQLCMPNTASIGKRVNSPSSIMRLAPPPPSSAGWKIT